MFNSDVRREAIQRLEHALKQYEDTSRLVVAASASLFEQRKQSASLIENVECYVNELSNSPKEFNKAVAEYRVAVDRFSGTVERLTVEAARVGKLGSAGGGAGVAAGIGVAAFGPSAAMALAMTFGTASTGTAIATLSGAAATNAALAALGGGALAAGGGGMAAGQAFLALAGPVGWTIGGVALAGSAIFLHRRNAQIAEEASQKRVCVESKTLALGTARRDIEGTHEQTLEHSKGCEEQLKWLRANAPSDYLQYDAEQKHRLGAIVNNVNSLGVLIDKKATL